MYFPSRLQRLFELAKMDSFGGLKIKTLNESNFCIWNQNFELLLLLKDLDDHLDFFGDHTYDEVIENGPKYEIRNGCKISFGDNPSVQNAMSILGKKSTYVKNSFSILSKTSDTKTIPETLYHSNNPELSANGDIADEI